MQLQNPKSLTLEKIERQLDELRRSSRRESLPISSFRFHEGDCPGAHEADFDDSAWSCFEIGGSWGGYDKTAWFRAAVPIPLRLMEEKLALRFLVGPRDGGGSTAETMLYVNGFPLQAIDIWHEEAWLPPEVLKDGEIQIALKAWSGVLDIPQQRRFKVAELLRLEPRAEELFHLADTLLKTVRELDERDWRRVRMVGGLADTFNLLDWSRPQSEEFYCSAGEALAFLRRESTSWQSLEPNKPKVVGVGHAHIDLAWLWRVRHSREKAGRTFATVLHLMRQYPEYRFMHSSPQLYEWLEQDFPAVFGQVRSRIESGEWEITGGMWVESDVNLPSGESLIRQILYGRRYMREKFGKDSRVVWLPDVFGYPSSLPQILVKSGIRYFMTTKISWSQFNRFPHDTFRWRGIDGSEVLSHFITTPEQGSKAFTYNGQLEPRDVKGLWDNYQQKDVNDELLQAFGWGDGGGGPTKEMLEAARAMCNLPGLPEVRQGHVEPYFRRIEERVEGEELPVWDGELYLEYHRGTYTSQARTKRNNRQAEVLYHRAELLSAIASIEPARVDPGDVGRDAARPPAVGTASAQPAPFEYPDLSEGWKRLMLNQFHDILPGSSIREVYEDSEQDYEFIREVGEGALHRAERHLACSATESPHIEGPRAEGSHCERSHNEGPLSIEATSLERCLFVFNSTSFEMGGPLEVRSGILSTEAAAVDETGGLLPQQQLADGRMLLDVPPVPPLGYRKLRLSREGEPPAGVAVREAMGEAAGAAAAVTSGAAAGDASSGELSVSAITLSAQLIDTPFYRIELARTGQISRLFDKLAGRDVLAAGEHGNVLQAFEDKPLEFDAWDIDVYYQEKMEVVDGLVEAVVEEAGPLRGVLRLVWRYLGSTIEQRLTVYATDPRIDFETRVDWRESQILLKAAFPTSVRASRATFDVQFGSTERPTHWNTSWDWAKFEVVGHKWADLSEGNYGVALLNDCKYGYDVKDHVMRITLIKSPIRPDPLADKGEHVFTYSLLPHVGTWRQGEVLRHGYALNQPLWAVAGEGEGKGGFSFAAADRENVVVETVKRAEDCDGWIVRVYEAMQFRHQDVTLHFGRPLERAVECNLVEEDLAEGEALEVEEGSFRFAISPFEIKTFRVWFA